MLRPDQIQEVLNTDIRTPIPEPLVNKIKSLPPFIPIPGVFNFRDLSHDNNGLRPGYVYRSGNLSDILESGKSTIAVDLGITTVFDLRNESERRKAPAPTIPGVDIIWVPYGARPATLNLRDFAGEDQGALGYVKMYSGILEAAAPGFTAVFQHIRDNPDDPFIFHCSAGKDRTGVLASLILLLLHRPHAEIIDDYILTRVEVENARESLIEAFAANIGPDGLEVNQLSPEALGMLEMCGVRSTAMAAFLKAFERTYANGIEGYLTDTLGFTPGEVSTMRRNLTS